MYPTKRTEENKMTNHDAVLEIANKIGYWDCWDVCEKVGGRYVDNLELHYCQAVNAFDAGMPIKEIPQKVFGANSGDTLEDVLKSVMAQSYEDAELKSF